MILLACSGFCQTATDYYNKGKDLANLGEYSQALKEFDKAIEADANYAKAYNCRGIMKENTGDSRGATVDFNKCIALSPDFAAAYYNRGISYLRLGKSDEACADFNKALSMGYKQASKALAENCK